MRKKENLREVILKDSIVLSTSPDITQGSTNLSNVIVPPFSMLVNFLVTLPTTYTLNVLTMWPFHLQPIVIPPDFRRHGLVVTLLWQPIIQGSRDYRRINPLTFYPRKNVEIVIQRNILLLSLKQLYLPHLIENQSNI